MAKSLRRKSGTELVERHDAAKQRSTQPTQTTQPEREEKSIWSGLPSSSREQEKSIWSGLPSSGNTRQSQAPAPTPVNPSYQNYLNEYLKANERAVLSQSVPGMAERYQQAGDRLQDMASNPTRQAYGARSHINPQGILDVKYNDSRRFARTMGALRDVGVTPEEYQAIIGITPKSTQEERIEKTRNLVQADPQLMQTAIHQARLEGYSGGALDQSTLDYVNRIMGAAKRRNAVERREGVEARQKAADTQVPAWAQEAYRQGMTGEDSPLRRNVGLQYISQDGREDGTSPRREYARQMQDVSQIRETGVFDSTYIDQGQSGQAQGHWNPELLSTQGLHDYRDQLQDRKDALSDYPDRLAKVQDEYENRSILENITDQKALNDLWAEIANQYGVNPDRERAGDSIRDAQAMADDLDRKIKTLETEIQYRDAHADKPTDFDIESSYRDDKVRQGNGLTDEIYQYLGNPDYEAEINDRAEREAYGGDGRGPALAKLNQLEMYQVLTQSEREQFNYLYNHSSAQEAQAYLDSLMPKINARVAAADNQMYQEAATGNPFAAVALYMGNRLVRPVAGMAGAIGMGLAALGNQEAQDPNGRYYSMTGNIEAMDQAQAQAAGKALSVNIPYFNKPLGEMLYGAVTSAVDSAMSAKAGLALGGGNAKIAENAALLIMGTEAGTSEFRQAMLDGESGTESLIKGLVGAATEIITERLGINEYLEPNLTRGLVTRILAQSGIEGLEEIEGAVINGVYDELSGRNRQEAAHMANFYQDENGKNISMREARGRILQNQIREGLEAGVSGALSGGLMVGTQEAGITYQATRSGVNLKGNRASLDLMSKIYEDMSSGDKADFAKMMGIKAGDVTDVADQMAKMSNGKLGRMSMEMLERINSTLETARKEMIPRVQERLRKAGAEGTRKQAELIMDVVDNGFAIDEKAAREMERDGSFAETLKLIARQATSENLSPVRGLPADIRDYAAKMQHANDLAAAMNDKGSPKIKDSVDNRAMLQALDAVSDDSRPNQGTKKVTYHTTDGSAHTGKVVGIVVGGAAQGNEDESGTQTGKEPQASTRKPGVATGEVTPGTEAEGTRKEGNTATENLPGGSAESDRMTWMRYVAGVKEGEAITAANTLRFTAEGTEQPGTEAEGNRSTGDAAREYTPGGEKAGEAVEEEENAAGKGTAAGAVNPGSTQATGEVRGTSAEAGKAGNARNTEEGAPGTAETVADVEKATAGGKTSGNRARVEEITNAEAGVTSGKEAESGKAAGDGVWSVGGTSAEGNAIQPESAEGTKSATAEVEENPGQAEAGTREGESAEAGKDAGEGSRESTGEAGGENVLPEDQERGKTAMAEEDTEEEGTAESLPDVYLAIEDENGKIEHVSVDDIDAIDDDLVAAAVKMAEDSSTLYTPEELSTMISLYDGGDAAGYIDSFNRAYTAGYYGTALEAHTTPYVRSDTADVIYRMGQAAAQRTEQVRLSTLNRNGGRAGELVVDDSVDISALDENQRSGIAVLDKLSKALGVNIRIFESQADENGRYASDNGKFDPNTNTISIDVHSGRNYTPEGYTKVNEARKAQGKPELTIPQYALLRTAAHELTHYIEHGSGEGYAALRRMVVDQLGRAGYDFDSMVGDKLIAYKAAGYRLTRGGAVAEVIADAMEMMLEDPDTLQRLAAKEPSLFKRMQAKLEDLLEKVRKAFFGVSAGSREARALMTRDANGILRYSEELRKAWVDALIQAGQTEDVLRDVPAEVLGADTVQEIEAMRADEQDSEKQQEAQLEMMSPGSSQLSIRQLAKALDMDMLLSPMAQIPYQIVDKQGNPVKEITRDMIMSAPAGTLIKSAIQYGTITQEQGDKIADFYGKLGTMAIKYMDPAMVWQLEGSELFSAIKSNSDTQYTQTVDFGTVCAKTQAVVDTISDTMLRLGRGLTRTEVIDAYKATYQSGQSVPCPVCYVFSRWMGVPSLLQTMKNAQEHYGDLTAEELTAYVDDMLARYKDINAAKTKVTKKLQQLEEKIQERLKKDQNASIEDLKPELDKWEKQFDELSAYNFVTQVICKRVRKGKTVSLYRDASGKVVRDPQYRAVPDEVLFDLRRGADFAKYYEKAWLFRTTRGAGLGKAILPYSGHTLGDFVHPIDRWTDKQNPYYKGAVKKGAQSIGYAVRRMLPQNLIGGFRLQSTSDYRPEWGLDYLMNFLEMQMCGAKAQMYTKVLEAVDLFATSGAMVNLSIMPLGSGIRTVNGKDELVFSKVNGIDFDGAYQKTLEYDNVQMILVGINDKHIRMAMADDRITFIIPWHSSGNSKDTLKMLIEGMSEKMGDAHNYEDTQNDKFREDRTEEQKHLWDLRMNILTGAYLKKGKLTVPDAEMQEIRNDAYLNDLFRRFYEDKSETDTYHVKLGKEQAKKIFPYEYWDKTSTIQNADVNGIRFAEYCAHFGITPRFNQFAKDKGYWKLLIDRRMYDLNGDYYEPKVIDVTKFRAEAVPTSVSQAKYGNPVQQAAAVQDTIDRIKARAGYNFTGYVMEDDSDEGAGQASIRTDDPRRIEDPETYFDNTADVTRAGWITPRNHLITRDSRIEDIYGIEDPAEAAYAMMLDGGIRLKGSNIQLAVTPEKGTQTIMVNHAMSELGPGRIQIMDHDKVINSIPYKPGDDIRNLLTGENAAGRKDGYTDADMIRDRSTEEDTGDGTPEEEEEMIDASDALIQQSIRDAMDDGTAAWSYLYQMGPEELQTTEQAMAHHRFKIAVDGMRESEVRLEQLRKEYLTAPNPQAKAMTEGKIRAEEKMYDSYRDKAEKALQNPALQELETQAREFIRDFDLWRNPEELEKEIGQTQERLAGVNAQIQQIWERTGKNKGSGVKALDQAAENLRQAEAEAEKAPEPAKPAKRQKVRQAEQAFDTVLRSTESAGKKAPKTTAATRQQMRDYETVKQLRAERDKLKVQLDQARRQLQIQKSSDSLKMTEMRQKYMDMLTKERQEYREREKLRRTLEDLRQKMTKYRRVAGKNIAYMDKLIRNETDYKNVPEIAKPAVEALLKRVAELDAAGNGTAFDARTAQYLYDFYTKELDELDDSEKEFADNIREMLDNLNGIYDSMRYTKGMSREDYYKIRAKAYEQIAEITKFFRTYIETAQAIFIGEQKQNIWKLNAQVLGDMPEKSRRSYAGPGGKAVQAAHQAIVSNNLTPVYFFRHLKNGGLSTLWEGLHEGENTYGIEMLKAREKVKDIQDRYHYWDWAKKDKDILTLTNEQGRTVRLTREQAMSLYAAYLREHRNGMDSHHLDIGGFVTKEDFDNGKLMRSPELGRFSGTKMGDPDMAKVAAWLTQEQKDYINAMVGLLSKDMAELGNRASLKLYGIKKYKEKFYYPFKSFQGNLAQRSDAGAGGKNAQDHRQKNRGFTKRLLRNATSAIMLEDFSETVANHISEMITYSTMAVPIENFNKLLNVKNFTPDDSIITTRSMMEMKYGKEASDYISRLLEVLNGGIRSDAAEDVFGRMVSLFKRGGVTGSLSVAMQQPLSYIRAAALINPRYLISTAPDVSGKAYEEAMRYAGTAVIKDIGGFDVGVGKSNSSWLLDNQEISTADKARQAVNVKDFDTFKDRWNDITGFLPGKMDAITWGQMWKAVKKEQAALNPDMDPDSEGFLEMCGRRFNDVMALTQVYDSSLSKSLNMQSKSTYMKMLTAFMNEPTLTANLLYDSFVHARDKDMKDRIAPHTAIALTVLSAVAQAAVKGLFSAGRRRDPDKDQTLLEKIASGFAGNLLQELNPLNLLPGVKDVVDVLSGDTLERTDLSIISEIVTAFENFGKGKITDAYSFLEQVAGSVAKLVGMPVKNVMRDVRAMVNIFDGVTGIDMSWFPGVGNAKRASNMSNVGINLQEQINPLYGGTDYKSYAERLYKALRSGDEAQAEKYRDYMTQAKKMSDSSMAYYLKQQLLEDYQGGNMTRDEAAELGVRIGVFDNVKSAWNYLAKSDDAKAHEGDDDYTASIYGGLTEAVRSGDASRVQQEAQELIAHGTSESTVNSKIKTAIADWYKAGDITAGEAEQLLKTLTDVRDEEDIYWWFDKQDHLQQAGEEYEPDPYDYNPESVSYSKYGDLIDQISAGNVSGMKSEISRLEDHGEKADSLKSRTVGYIGTAWMDGEIDQSTAARLYREIQPEATDNDVYWFFDNYEHKRAHANDKSYTYSRYNDLLNAMTSGGDWQSEWQRVLEHTDKGTSKTVQKAAKYNVGQRITTVYKPQLVQLVKDGRMAEAAELQAMILDLYANIGYERGERLKAVKKWYKDYID